MSRSFRDRGPTISASVEVTTDADVEVEIEDLSDEELRACIDEATRRGVGGIVGSRRDRLVPVYEDLVAGRTGKALEKFERAMFAEEDGHLLDCWNSLREGRWSAAICALDGAVYPAPVKTEKELALFKKRPALSVTQEPANG